MEKQYLFTIMLGDDEFYELAFTGTLKQAEALCVRLNKYLSWAAFHEIRAEVTK